MSRQADSVLNIEPSWVGARCEATIGRAFQSRSDLHGMHVRDRLSLIPARIVHPTYVRYQSCSGCTGTGPDGIQTAVTCMGCKRPGPCSGRRAGSLPYRFGHAGPAGDARDRRPRGRHHQPGQGLLRGSRPHEARPRPLLPRRRRRCAARRRFAPDGAQAVRQRRRRRVLLPETRPRVAAALDRDGRAELPVRSHRR